MYRSFVIALAGVALLAGNLTAADAKDPFKEQQKFQRKLEKNRIKGLKEEAKFQEKVYKDQYKDQFKLKYKKKSGSDFYERQRKLSRLQAKLNYTQDPRKRYEIQRQINRLAWQLQHWY